MSCSQQTSGRIHWQIRRAVLRRGFTLVELLVVVSILLILCGIVAVSFNSNYNSERVRGSARSIQSAMLGAQSRVVMRKSPTGLRLVLDAADPTVANGFVYIGATKDHREGTLTISRPDADGDSMPDSMDPQPFWWLVGSSTRWYRLYQQNLLVEGARIRIPATGNWYTIHIDTNVIDKDVLVLNTDFRNPPIYPEPNLAAQEPMDYILELQPTLLPDEKPLTFASGMVIDLYNSRIPSTWYSQVSQSSDPGGNWREEGLDPTDAGKKIYRQYSPRMDIMFSPRGEVTGPLAAHGILHMLLADVRDTIQNFPPEAGQHDCIGVSLFTRTGSVVVSPVDKERSLGADGQPGEAGTDDDGNGVTDRDKNGIADPNEVGYAGTDDTLIQRFRFAEMGSTSK